MTFNQFEDIRENIARISATIGAERLTALGYKVLSSGYGNICVDVGTDSHRIITVNYTKIDAFIEQYPI